MAKKTSLPALPLLNSDDEELSSDRDQDLMNDEGGEILDFDFEAFPMEIDDREGIVNMLTQIFLRADIDTVALADAIIKQSPFGNVIGPAEDNSDEDSTNVVYGLLTLIELNNPKTETSKYAKEVLNFVLARARSYALKDILKSFDENINKRIALFINERMLNFPTQIISPSFSSIRMDIAGLKKPLKNILYIHKLRIADTSSDTKLVPASSVSSVPAKKRRRERLKRKDKQLLRWLMQKLYMIISKMNFLCRFNAFIDKVANTSFEK
uniref:Protein BCCIP homolog n=1 Tax=Heterorhabditis bacteriophora TaxID=37862 RepID=A0A1I7X989_HETBA